MNDKKIEIAAVWEDVTVLVPWDQNPRNNKDAVQSVANSIKRFGFGAPIVARKTDRMVIAGHTRLEAAKLLGLSQVPVRYLDLDPADAKMLALADNRIGEIAQWDQDVLSNILQEMHDNNLDLDVLGFDDDELSDLLSSTVDQDTTGSIDDVDDLDDDYGSISKVGEVYNLGPHRLICGDSTDPATWDKLMQGDKADLCITDPPYGVSYVGGTKDALTIKNDSLSVEDLQTFLDSVFICIKEQLKSGRSVYVFSPARDPLTAFCNVLYKHQLFKHSLIWNKDRFALGRSDYHYKHEIIFYGWKEGEPHYFVNDRTKDSVIDFARPSINKEHPTMKPIGLICELIKNSSKKDWVVIDAFGGSGSTLMAAAETGRIARLVELDPKYCDVIRRRWAKYAKQHHLDMGDGIDE